MEEKTQIERIIDYVKTFSNVVDDEEELLKYSTQVVINRVLLYLDHEELDKRFEMIVADVVIGVFNKYKNNQDSNDVEQSVSSLSDNGQSISYRNEMKNYLSTASDNELLSGVVNLISRYRRIGVAGSKKFQETDI